LLNNVAALFGGVTVAGDFESISTAVGTGSSGTITFNSIPSTYKHLQLRWVGFQSTGADVVIKLNASTTGLNSHYIQGLGSGTPTAGRDTGTADGQYFGTIGFDPTYPTVGVVDILDYTSTSKYKTMRLLGGVDKNGSGRVFLESALFDTTSVISSITIKSANSFTTATHFALYGIKG
jgi:hypothetical protein